MGRLAGPAIFLQGWGCSGTYIGAGIGIEIAAAIRNPDMTARPEGLNVPVATVTLTVTPLP